MRECLDAGGLARYITRSLDAAGMLEAARHVVECDACGERVRLLHRVQQAGVAAVVATLDRVAALVDELNKVPPHRWPGLACEPRFRDPDFARRLIALAIDERGRDDQKALLLSECATISADRLPPDVVNATDIRFEAWKLHSALLREAGRFTECEKALDRAMEAAGSTTEAELSRAVITFSRALIYAEPDIWKPDEALALLDEAANVFAERDRQRLRKVLQVRGMVLWRSGEVEAARHVFRQALARTPPENEAEYAGTLANLAQATLDCGMIDEAETLLQKAQELYTRAESVTDIGRCEWIAALIERARGHSEAELSLALAAMERFDAAGMTHMHVRAGLVAVSALVATGRAEAALALARSLAGRSIGLDEKEPKARRTRTAEALAFLHDAARR